MARAPAAPPAPPRIDLGPNAYITVLPVMRLAEAPYNPRAIHPDNLERLRASLEKFGMVELPVFNERAGQLVSGHQRLRLLREQGATSVACVVVNLDDNDEKELNILLNAGEVRGQFTAQITPLLKSIQTHDPTGFATLGLGALLKSVQVTGHTRVIGGGPITEDEGGYGLKPGVEAITQPGDLWVLGDHRLLCGDSTHADVMDRLLAGQHPAMLLTDPPYAIYGSSTGIGADITDDNMVRPFFEAIFREALRALPYFAHLYVFCDWRTWAVLWECARRVGAVPKNCVVWDKGNGLGTAYSNTHEFVGFFAKLPAERAMKSSARRGQRLVKRPNLVRHHRAEGEDREHNAAKPPLLISELIENSSDPGDIVLDMFLGSGTTLVCAHALGRRCYAVELKPGWCDVAVRRWERATGETARRIPAAEVPAAAAALAP